MFHFSRFTLSILLCFLPLTLISAQPTCADPPTEDPPKLIDCIHVISHIQRLVAETGNPLYTASRREGSNIHMPNLFWDHIPDSSCGVRLDMIDTKQEALDYMHLSDVAYAAQKIMEKCISPESAVRTSEGWMTAGRYGLVNVTVERLHWDVTGGGLASGGLGGLRLPNGTVARGNESATE